jgi:hypothetical protein
VAKRHLEKCCNGFRFLFNYCFVFSSIVAPMRRSSERSPQTRVSIRKNSDAEARLV